MPPGGEKAPGDLHLRPHTGSGLVPGRAGGGDTGSQDPPNVVDRIGSINMAPIGTNFISLDPRAPWPEAEREKLCRFLSPFGENIFLTDDDSLALLAVKITAHIFYEISFSVADVCESRGIPVTLAQLGSAVRAARFSMPDCQLPQLCPCGYDGLPDRVAEFMRRLTLAWYAGIEAYAGSLSYTIPGWKPCGISTPCPLSECAAGAAGDPGKTP